MKCTALANLWCNGLNVQKGHVYSADELQTIMDQLDNLVAKKLVEVDHEADTPGQLTEVKEPVPYEGKKSKKGK